MDVRIDGWMKRTYTSDECFLWKSISCAKLSAIFEDNELVLRSTTFVPLRVLHRTDLQSTQGVTKLMHIVISYTYNQQSKQPPSVTKEGDLGSRQTKTTLDSKHG